MKMYVIKPLTTFYQILVFCFSIIVFLSFPPFYPYTVFISLLLPNYLPFFPLSLQFQSFNLLLAFIFIPTTVFNSPQTSVYMPCWVASGLCFLVLSSQLNYVSYVLGFLCDPLIPLIILFDTSVPLIILGKVKLSKSSKYLLDDRPGFPKDPWNLI